MKRLTGNVVFARFLRFGALGVASFFANLGITVALHDLLGTSAEVAYAVALVTVMIMNFLLCRYVVFDAGNGSFRAQAVQFLAGACLFRGAEYVGFLVLHSLLGLQYVVAIVVVQVLAFLGKFAYFSRGAFRVPGETTEVESG